MSTPIFDESFLPYSVVLETATGSNNPQIVAGRKHWQGHNARVAIPKGVSIVQVSNNTFTGSCSLMGNSGGGASNVNLGSIAGGCRSHGSQRQHRLRLYHHSQRTGRPYLRHYRYANPSQRLTTAVV